MKKIKKMILIILLLLNISISKSKNIKIDAKSYILVDFYSNKILAKKNPDLKLAPASLTKIMTNYIVSDYIKKKKINKKDLVLIKKNSWYKNPIFKNSSLMFINKNQKIKIDKLNKGMIIISGNDACIAITNHISNNEKKFTYLMNKYSKIMNLKNTNFKNSHGLDDINQYTTSRDIAKLSIKLIKNFPKEYKIYKKKFFKFNNIKQKNRNDLLWNKKLNIDGIKTGHTDLAKYNIVVSAKKKKTRLIVVILGSKSIKDRNIYAKKLLEWGFNNFKTKKIFLKNKIIKYENIWLGKKNKIKVGINKNIYVTFNKNKNKKKKIYYKIFNILKAPIYKNQIIGEIYFKKNNKIQKHFLLKSLTNVKVKNKIQYIFEYIYMNIYIYISNILNKLTKIF